MIERVARVMARQAAIRGGKDEETAKSFADIAWPDYAADANAVLAEARDPNRSMIDAGEAARGSGFDVFTIFTHMVDAALAENV